MTDTVISENFSENTKQKRGRPRNEIWYFKVYQEKLQELSASPTQSSFRTLQNTDYRIKAIRILWPKNEIHDLEFIRYQWLLGVSENWIEQKRTILTELGRVHAITHNDELDREMAEYACENKPKTQDFIRMLRSVRRDVIADKRGVTE